MFRSLIASIALALAVVPSAFAAPMPVCCAQPKAACCVIKAKCCPTPKAKGAAKSATCERHRTALNSSGKIGTTCCVDTRKCADKAPTCCGGATCCAAKA